MKRKAFLCIAFSVLFCNVNCLGQEDSSLYIVKIIGCDRMVRDSAIFVMDSSSSCGTLKQYVDGKIPGGFDSRKMPVRLGDAINNSEKLYSEKNGEPDKYTTEVYKLGKVIFPFVVEIFR